MLSFASSSFLTGLIPFVITWRLYFAFLFYLCAFTLYHHGDGDLGFLVSKLTVGS